MVVMLLEDYEHLVKLRKVYDRERSCRDRRRSPSVRCRAEASSYDTKPSLSYAGSGNIPAVQLVLDASAPVDSPEAGWDQPTKLRCRFDSQVIQI